MIQILVTAAFILLFLKLSDKENVIDYFGAFTIYLAPLALVFALSFVINFFQLPVLLHFIAFASFFVVPFLIINAICKDYTVRKKVLLSLGVFAIVITTQIIQSVLSYSLQHSA
jgi:hypothetical protein